MLFSLGGKGMHRLQLADQGALLLHTALQPGKETEHQLGPLGQEGHLEGQPLQGSSLSLGQAPTSAGHLGTEMMRYLNTGAAITMIKETLQEEPEDNPQISYEQTNPAQLINLLPSTLRSLGLFLLTLDKTLFFLCW